MTSWQLVRLFAGLFILVSTLLTLLVIPVLYYVAGRRSTAASNG